jgi:ribosome-associated protein
MSAMNDIEVGESGIRLGQFLKLANVTETGGEVKELLAAGLVRVNGTVETRRGAQLRPGDVVTFAANEFRVS